MGTACSGTDLISPTLGLLSELFDEEFALELDFVHKYSCEIVPDKRRFIMEHMDVPRMYSDLTKLSSDLVTDVEGRLRIFD